MKIKRNRTKQKLYLKSPDVLRDDDANKLVLYSIYLTCALLFSLVTWSAFTSVSEIALTQGEVVTHKQVQIVQHLEGGIVSKIYVKNGDVVKSGKLLVEIDPTGFLAQLEQYKARAVSFELDRKRLRAFIKGDSKELDLYLDKLRSGKMLSRPASNLNKMINDEKLMLRSQYKHRLDQLAVLKSQIEQQKSEVNRFTKKEKITKNHIYLLNQEYEMYKKLRDKQYYSKKDYLYLMRELNKANGDLSEVSSNLEKSKQKLIENRHKYSQLNSQLKQAAVEKLGEISSQILETKEMIKELKDKVNRTYVIAKLDGVVKGLEVTPGRVIETGGVLLEIVPANSELLIESKIATKDIGYIETGLPVRVKVSTYNHSIYGVLEGRLINISASTFHDEQDGEPYFKATIQLARNYIAYRDKKLKLLPGMTVEADIITGKKTILQYLLKPIHRVVGNAFTER